MIGQCYLSVFTEAWRPGLRSTQPRTQSRTQPAISWKFWLMGSSAVYVSRSWIEQHTEWGYPSKRRRCACTPSIRQTAYSAIHSQQINNVAYVRHGVKRTAAVLCWATVVHTYSSWLVRMCVPTAADCCDVQACPLDGCLVARTYSCRPCWVHGHSQLWAE